MEKRIVSGDPERSVFVVDPDPAVRAEVAALAQALDARVAGFDAVPALVERLGGEIPGCLVLEMDIGGRSGLELLRELGARMPLPPVIFVSRPCPLAIAVSALRAGALHFLQKPLPAADLSRAIEEAFRFSRGQVALCRQHGDGGDALDGRTPAEWRLLTRLAEARAAQVPQRPTRGSGFPDQS